MTGQKARTSIKNSPQFSTLLQSRKWEDMKLKAQHMKLWKGLFNCMRNEYVPSWAKKQLDFEKSHFTTRVLREVLPLRVH